MNLINAEPHLVVLEPDDSHQLATLCGPFDAHLKQIERRMGITINNRGNDFELIGDQTLVRAAGELLNQLYREVNSGTRLTAEVVHLFLQESGVEALLEEEQQNDQDLILTRKKSIKPRGGNQVAYVRAIRENDVNFGIGPAGTGKTYLAVACAVEALEQERIRRILLVRPAVEAGEKLGFLPGDLAQNFFQATSRRRSIRTCGPSMMRSMNCWALNVLRSSLNATLSKWHPWHSCEAAP